MDWWNDFVEWLNSEDGWRTLSGTVIPFVAILIAGLVAALIGRHSTRRVIAMHDREQRTSTVSALIGAARRASKWNALSLPEQQHAEHLANEADVNLRLLPLGGAMMTADWAAREIAEMKKNSVSFSFQADQSLLDFRDRLVEWQARPSRAKKLFKADLDLWAYEAAQDDGGLVEKQRAWAKKQVATEAPPSGVEAATSQPTPPIHQERTVHEPLVRQPIAYSSSATPQTSTTDAAQAPASQRPITWDRPAAVESHTGEAPAVLPAGVASSSPESSPRFDSTDTSETPGLVAPSPVSAHAVRQRTLADDELDDDIRE